MTMIQRAGTAQKVFDMGWGGGGIKNDKDVIFFFLFQKREGAKGSPAPPSAWSLERQ